MGTIKFISSDENLKSPQEQVQNKQVLGAQQNSANIINEEQEIILAENSMSAKTFALFEDDSKRDNHTKHFKMSDGSYKAEIYDEEIHYYDENQGKFVAINNTLEYETAQNDDDIDGYKIRDNNFNVKLSSNTSDKKLFIIKKELHEVVWKLKNNISNVALSNSNEINYHALDFVSSEVNYINAFNNADLNYRIIGNRIKENIIVKSNSEKYEYEFELKAKNLNIKLSDDNQSLIFYVKEMLDDGRILDKDIFIIPAPFMFDANGEISEDVYYEIENLNNGSYVFKIIADEKWINDATRQMPVTIDPMIIVNKDYSSLQTKTVGRYSTSNYSEYSSIYRTIGVNSGQINRMYVKFNMPSIDSNSLILSSFLDFKHYTSSNSKGLEVRKVNNYFNLPTMTWNTQASYNFYDINNIIDYMETNDISANTDNKYRIDLTQYVEDIVLGTSANNGIVVKAIDESILNNYIKVYSEMYSSVSYQPMMTINYRSSKGKEEKQSYQKNSVKRAGESFVNLRNGNLTFMHNDLSLSGNKLPISISHIYNGHMSGSDFIYNMGYNISGSSLRAGKGWKLNLQQMLIKAPLSTGTAGNYRSARYIYIDSDGTEHYFVDSGETDTCTKVFVDDSGLGLSMAENSNIIKDSNKNEMHFNSSGFLTKIKNKHNIQQNIYYDASNRISYIVDGGGRYTYFYYNNCCYLDRIVEPSNKITYFKYDSNNYLTSIQYFDNSKTLFTYENGKLKTVKDKSGYILTYTYNGAKVIKVAEQSSYSKISKDGLTGLSSTKDFVDINYVSLRKTIVKNNKNIKMTYVFNEYGETIAMYEDSVSSSENNNNITRVTGNIAFSGKDEDKIVNANISQSSKNFIANGSFSNKTNSIPNNWSGYRNGSSYSGIGFYTSAVFADGSEAYGLNGEKSISKKLEQLIDIAEFKSQANYGKNIYVLSGWAKGDSVSIKDGYGTNDDRKFELRALVTYSDYTSKTHIAKFDARNRDWQIAATAFSIDEDVNKTLASIKIAIEYRDNANTMYFDNIRLIKGTASITETKIFDSAKNKYYDFDEIQKVSYATYGYCCSCVSNRYGYVTKKDMQLMLDDYENNYYSSAVRMNNGKLVLAYARNIQFEMSNGEIVYIGNIRLQNTTRVNNGKIESMSEPEDNGKKVTSHIYSEGVAFNTENRYDNKQQLIYSRDYRDLVQENTYDSYGNITESITYSFSEGKYSINRLVTSNTYSSSGNFLSSELDPRYKDSDSSDIKTRYSYSNTTGLLNNMTMANNQVINYSYDSLSDNIIGVSSYVNGVANSNSYAYNLDYLTTITHNGFSYNFEYDGFGNITSAKINEHSLLSKQYTYTSSNDTEIVNYASGDSLKYEYDNYGRLIKTYLNNALKVENTFTDEKGANNSSSKLTKNVDNYANLEYNYEYDVDGEIKGYSYSGENSGNVAYNRDIANNRINSVVYNINGDVLNYSYDYEKKNGITYPDNKPEKITLANHFSSVVATDKLGRNLNKTTTANGLNITNINDYLESGYYDYCNRLIKDRTTPYISKVTQTVNNVLQSSDYTYDKNGNITQILSSSGNIYYTYDALNRLKQEDNRILGKTSTFNYDVGGNITSKTIVTSGVTTTIPYAYNNSWKDQLTSYNGQSISYDSMGNPTNYLGNMLTWTRGRMLASFGAYTYNYNANGIRTQKTVSGIMHKYTLEGSKILREDRVSSSGTDNLIYYYDLDGIIGFGLKKQGESSFTQYYYTKNLQGDITAIYNTSGAKLASYTYDAWGNITVGTNANNLANINPFRYRSYYYDMETLSSYI